VISFLADAGYEVVEQPQPVAGIPFEFAGMLAGRTSLDLIAVVDLAIDLDDDVIRRRIEGLARALDLVRSRRSLTVVLVGPRRPALIRAIAGVARVLSVGTLREDDDRALPDALAVLLPLEVTTEGGGAADSWPATRERMMAEYPKEIVPVLSAARSGETAVEMALGEILRAPIAVLRSEREEEE
jgi:hypothetical protein